MKKAVILIILAFFLIGCQSALEKTGEEIDKIGEEADQIQKDIDAAITAGEGASKIVEEVTLPNGTCKPQWKCISSKTKAYQDENCEFSQKTRCDHGCENATCYIPPAKVCTAGFKCVNNFTKGYQLESCKFTDKTDCEFRCENNKCIPKPENYTEPEPEPEPPKAAALPSNPKLNMDETADVDGHTLKIRIIESDQVKISIDDYGSNWLFEGDKFTKDGLTIEIKGIYFQQYAGGKQEIEYQVS